MLGFVVGLLFLLCFFVVGLRFLYWVALCWFLAAHPTSGSVESTHFFFLVGDRKTPFGPFLLSRRHPTPADERSELTFVFTLNFTVGYEL